MCRHIGTFRRIESSMGVRLSGLASVAIEWKVGGREYIQAACLLHNESNVDSRLMGVMQSIS